VTRPTFVLKLQSQRDDGIHGLRHVLKRLLRTHGFICVAAYEEKSSTEFLNNQE
jgi:hypothetical protein